MTVSRDLLAAIDLLPEPMVLVRVEGEILAVNVAFARQMGRSRESFVGTSLEAVLADPWREVGDYLGACARSERLVAGSLALRHPDGATLEFLAGGAGYAVGEGARTEPAESVLLRLEARTDSAGFLAVLAHELRNPLAPIRTALEVMRVSAGDQAVATAARSMIERQLQQLVRLIDGLTTRPADAAVAPEPAAKRKPAPVRARILVADDNRDAAQSLAFMLEIEGHDVRTAHDGVEAVELAEAFRPQLALLDIGMPRQDGYAAARELRGKAWGGSVCLVALTGWGQEEDRLRAQEAGFDRHLVKPVDPKILNALIAQVLQT